MANKAQQVTFITLQQWFDANPDKSDVWFGTQMQPPVSHSCVQKWRKGSSVPRKQFMPQILKLTGGRVHASTFYF